MPWDLERSAQTNALHHLRLRDESKAYSRNPEEQACKAVCGTQHVRNHNEDPPREQQKANRVSTALVLISPLVAHGCVSLFGGPIKMVGFFMFSF